MFDCLSCFVCGSVASFLLFHNEYCQQLAEEAATNLLFFYIDTQLYLKKVLKGSSISDSYAGAPESNFRLVTSSVIKNLNETYSWISSLFQSSDNLEYIKDSKVVYTGLYDSEEDISFMNKETNYFLDFFVYTHQGNKMVHKFFPEKLYEYVVSNEHFIMAEVSFQGSRQFKVQFKTADYNYMIVGNRFDRDFIVYFLRKHYGYLSWFFDLDSYSLNIIDKDANIIVLDKEASLCLTEDGYVIETDNQ
jgi:translation elongation factor P/translation initiation factor 5A